ncbi:hypothetical protein [Methylobacterium currus]|uniref:hypothetical protein n=1 Tax=Methylobacterium currus TaxID=2051553 RepID=UPI0013DF0AB6|nr:hypothetical protein [Methylobacterium currus]
MAKPSKTDEAKPLREPDDREKAAMDRALERYKARPAALEYSVSTSPEGGVGIKRPHSDTAGHLLHCLDTFGTASSDFASNAVTQLGSVLREEKQELPTEQALNAGLAAVSGIAPQDEIEAMLAVQMVATHDVAMKALRKLAYTSDVDRMEKFGNIATKMMRTYTTQLEALAKLRRGGAQTVRVEHVHVYQGGQAIVGNVQGGGVPRGQIENGQQAHATDARALAVAPGAPMLCADPAGTGMPVAGSVGEAPVPDARRREGKRGAGR